LFKSQGNVPPAGKVDGWEIIGTQHTFSCRCTDRGKLMMKGEPYYRTRCTPPPWGVCATGTGYDTTLGQHSRLQSIPPVHPAHRDGAIGMDPHRHPEDGCTSPPPYLGHAIPPPSQRGWTGTEASVRFGRDGNGSPYLLGWTAGSIPASIPSLWDGECSPSPPPSRRPPSLFGGMESGTRSRAQPLGRRGTECTDAHVGRCVTEVRRRTNIFVSRAAVRRHRTPLPQRSDNEWR
jgi:hypothetical protein